MLFAIWDANSSFALNTGVTMDGLATLVSSGGAGYSYTSTALSNWLAGSTGAVSWTIFANDQFGAQRGLTTSDGSNGTATLTNGNARAANGNKSSFIGNQLNLGAFGVAGVTESVVSSTSAAYIGNSSLSYTALAGYGYNFNSNGSLANSDYATGMNVISVNAVNATTTKSIYAQVGTPVAAHAWMAGNTFTIGAVAAVPEADSLAMLLAGMGLVGSIARRRNRKTA
ncbi:hypothetical protein DIC66_16460 [Rhodoferax lacus]|uniref:Ice-binding protein C-terminal domain-containing protein n=2 Tax=Rhodoferax lacus TaxID=2184758 RepID=A0A3E1R945_9BURK|nr:hypothetical protein DIC66_16460 [Rhodoferax lacus]